MFYPKKQIPSPAENQQINLRNSLYFFLHIQSHKIPKQKKTHVEIMLTRSKHTAAKQ